MLPIELAVRIEPGGGRTFGSGILVGQSHVLTCAHVVDPSFSKARYIDPGKPDDELANFNDLPEHCRELALRMNGHTVDVFTYDGECRKATLAAVHEFEDLVLIRLCEPLLHPVRLPALQTNFAATTQTETAGLGFRCIRGTVRSLGCETLRLAAPDSLAFSARSSVLMGQASEGMSGGPVMMLLPNGKLVIAGMLTMGGSKQPTCKVIRADTLSNFLELNHVKAFVSLQSELAPGIAPAAPASSGLSQTEDFWLPLPRTKKSGDDYGYVNDCLRFIAARPLTFADIDAVTGHRTSEQNRLTREGFFAPMTVGEAKKISDHLGKRYNARVSIADREALCNFEPPEDNETNGALDCTPAELVLPPEWDIKHCPEEAGAFFPAGGIPEWVTENETDRLAFVDPKSRRWETTILPRTLRQKSYRALLRPMLTVSVWATAE